MIRYEIISNVSTSGQSLRDHPELIDLAQSLAVKDLDIRFVTLTVREEEQINVASAKIARGVTVKETAVRTRQPQASLKGCLDWVKAVAGKFDRGMHLDIGKIRSSNGAGLVLTQVLPKGNKVFGSGLEDGNWERLVARPDITLQKIPPEIERNKGIKNEYRQRGTRTSFFDVLRQMTEVYFLPAEFRKKAEEIVKSRNANRLTEFTDAEIVNVGLISDTLERYQKLLDDFFIMVKTGQLGGDLPAVFGLLTQGIAFEELKKALLPFTLASKRSRIDNKRILINEVRIGIAKGEPSLFSDLQRKFAPVVLKARLAQDPPLYRKLVPLQAADAEETEALETARRMYKPIFNVIEKIDMAKVNPATMVPDELKMVLYEMLVTLVYQCEFTVMRRSAVVSKKAELTRKLLKRFTFANFEVSSLHSLNPKLPVKGIAHSLVGKVPLTMGELGRITGSLTKALFPMAPLAKDIAQLLVANQMKQESQRSTDALRSYLNGANPMLRNTNYLIGGVSGLTPVMRGGAASAGRGLGLTVIASQDEIRNRETQERLRKNPNLEVAGYIALMNGADKRFFPLKANLEMIARAYRFLYGERIVVLVRRFVSNKINQLLETYGDRLFEAIYQHLVWDHQMTLSRYQTGMILFREKVFDPQRLKEFGFQAGAMANGHERDNPWLHSKNDTEGEAGGGNPHTAASVEKEYQLTQQAFQGLLQKCGELAKSNGNEEETTLAGVIAAKSQEMIYDLFDPRFREDLAGCDAAEALWAEFEAVASKNEEALPPQETEGEAINIRFSGPLAYLSLLKEAHSCTIGETEYLFRIRPAWDDPGDDLSGVSGVLANGFKERLASNGGSENVKRIKPALELLQSYCQAWSRFRSMAEIALIDQMLRETVLAMLRPTPPEPRALRGLKPGTVMCLGMSSSDQIKFNRLVSRIDLKDAYLTLSQLASWLATFVRLREEMEDFREIIADIQGIITSLNVSLFDAPYITRYGSLLKTLDDLLSIAPEDFHPEDQKQIERAAIEIEVLMREYFEKERSFAPRDRYLNRITTRLRNMRPETDLNFVHQLHELASVQATSTDDDDGKLAVEQTRSKGRYQTFPHRLRNVMEYRQRVTAKSVYVLSPGSSQRQLTINLIDQLFRLKGIFTPILADVTSSEGFIDQLRTRLPPHRLFNLTQL